MVTCTCTTGPPAAIRPDRIRARVSRLRGAGTPWDRCAPTTLPGRASVANREPGPHRCDVLRGPGLCLRAAAAGDGVTARQVCAVWRLTCRGRHAARAPDQPPSTQRATRGMAIASKTHIAPITYELATTTHSKASTR